MQGILRAFKEMPEFKSLKEGLAKNHNQQIAFGLTGSQNSLLIAGLASTVNVSSLVITAGEGEAISLFEDLYALLPEVEVCYFPVRHLLPYQIIAESKEGISRRLKALVKLCQGERVVVVASVEALLRRLSPPECFASSTVKLTVGELVQLQYLVEKLCSMGYERTAMVESPGQFSLRGGILDIYPLTVDRPLRIEFFDDQVDSIRMFSVDTQRSEEKLSYAEITPATELVVALDDKWEKACQTLKNEFSQMERGFKKSGLLSALDQLIAIKAEVLKNIESRIFFSGIEHYLPYFYQEQVTLVDYLPARSLVFIEELLRVKEVIEMLKQKEAETYSDLITTGKVLPSQLNGQQEWKDFYKSLEKHKVIFCSFLPREGQNIRPQNVVTFPIKSVQSYHGRLEVLTEEIRDWRKKGFAVILLVSDKERVSFLLNILKEHQIEAFDAGLLENTLTPGSVAVAIGRLSKGFVLSYLRLVVITEKEIYGFSRKKQIGQRMRKENRLASFNDLKVGDYVVHVNHGIGRYLGIIPLNIGDVQKDYLLIQYAGEDKLYVPIDQVGLVQKYIGSEGESPRLSRLGGTEWSKVKGRVKEAVKELAKDLLALYAARETIKGHSFAADTVWQKEFEAAFPFEETPDQLRTIAEVKLDMEKSRPMDRLLCGDVGYGKTEVALRAAFKCFMEGKQVAMLVPTTILAQQHFNTFRERFTGYPACIEMLSRFRTPKEQQQVITGLSNGMVDIIIGTHRLVQEDITFKNLGLVIVDEEHRFGVAQKERLKLLRQDVDVLTLTATPIPRTLHMSLAGVRDTSLLETPPENRFPVQTYVLEEDPVFIREAIRRELSRGGQVYFVYNRIADLDKIASWLKELVPEARLAVAHGQMREDDLEQVMLDFINGVYNVLLCTTIIESGLDIGNVNTLIVKDADQLGLAQLYQLRGRVGRSNRLAYAYFTFQKDCILSEVAQKRLAAIKEFTDFGSGYKIALRDLEIRGAGSLLGVEQHGHIADIGFDLYCRMLEEAIQEVRGETKLKAHMDASIELPVEAFISDSFIADPNQKLELYRRLTSVRDLDEVFALEEEMIDRFGDLPEPTRNLLVVARLRALANKLGVKNIHYSNGFFRFHFSLNHQLTGEKLVTIGQEYRGRVKFSENDDGFELRLRVARPRNTMRRGMHLQGKEALNWLVELEHFLKKL